MARAVGTKRADLVQTFLAEGMAYNVVAAMVGTGLGVLVAVGMSRIMAAIFSEFDINISPHVTLRSLLISYSLGVVLTFATVTFSSWRVSQINIVRAIRDIPEPPTPKPVWRGHSFFATLRSLVFKESNGKAWRLRGGLILLGFVVQMGAGATDSGGLQLLFGTIGFLNHRVGGLPDVPRRVLVHHRGGFFLSLRRLGELGFPGAGGGCRCCRWGWRLCCVRSGRTSG